MEAAKKLRVFLNERQKSVLPLLKTSHKRFTVEDFHKLRVEIKKLNAAIHLLEFSKPGFDYKKSFKAYRKLFHQAGKVRDLQLHRNYLSKFGVLKVLPHYENELKSKQLEEVVEFYHLKSNVTGNKLHEAFHKDIAGLKNLNSQHFLRYMEREQDSICKLLKKSKLKVPQAHDLRKKVKSFYYLSDIIPLENKKLRQLNRFQDILGKWHDYEVLADRLSRVKRKLTLPKTELQRIKDLKQKIEKERENLFLKINSQRLQVLKN